MRRLIVLLILVGGTFLGADAADYAQAGVLAKNGKWELGVTFDPSVAPASISTFNNYTVNDPNAVIEVLRVEPLDHSAILTVSGLQSAGSLTLTNFQTIAGDTLPNATLSYQPPTFTWDAIGAQELGLTADSIAVGTNGFDLISGGIQMRDTYDEATFANQSITGDFDKKVRVLFQEPSSPSAKAGLMVREAVDAGRARPSDIFDPGQAFSRYISVQVNPAATAYTNDSGAPEPGANQYEISVRYYTGGIGSPNFDATENPTITNNIAPATSNAWVRLARTGQTFHAFRSSDGTNWVKLGTFRFPTIDASGNAIPAFSTNAFVGAVYGPEVGNIPEGTGARRAFFAQFRDYGNGPGGIPVDPVESRLTIKLLGSQVEISWTGGGGTLQTSTNIVSTNWTALAGNSPQRVTADKKWQFFRVKLQ